jgi:tetratricopeptide (TPR) repeat protein
MLLVAALLGIAAWPAWRESERIDVEIMPIAVPAALAERGMGPEVAATRLVDALNDVLARVTEASRNRPTKDDLGAIPAITATREGLSLRRMGSLVRELRGLPVRRIAGEVTLRSDGRLSVRLRVPGSASFAAADAAEGDDLDQALATIAPQVWRRLNPLVYAWNVADSGRAEDAIRPQLVALAQDFRLPPAVELRVTVLYARSLVRSGRAAEAVATIEDLERRAPTYPLLWNVKAQALADLGRVEPALDAQKQAVQHEGTSVWSHISSAHLLMKLGRPREALSDLQSARRLAPNSFDAVMLESMALLSLGRPAESLILINRVIEARPNLPGAQEARGNALLANGRPEDAIAAYDVEIARNPYSLTVRLARANALRALRRPQEALAAIDEILVLAPRDGMANVLRGWSILELGQHEQALAVFETVLRDRPNDVPALHGRGIALGLLGRRAEAIGSLNRAMEIQPGNRRIAAELARLRGVAPPGQARPPAPPAPASPQGGAPARP